MDSKPQLHQAAMLVFIVVDPYRLHLCELVFSLTSWSSSLSAKDLRVCIGSSSLSSSSPLLVDTNHSHRASSTILHLLQFPSWLCVSSTSRNQARAQVSTVNLHLISVVEGPIPSSNPLRLNSRPRVSSEVTPSRQVGSSGTSSVRVHQWICFFIWQAWSLSFLFLSF
ncbi:Uncharacterized protein Rs2_50263 [Raphanus sativus]|nr:Uncharacterized protein Rs2_50263 [Raphanus sativus]